MLGAVDMPTQDLLALGNSYQLTGAFSQAEQAYRELLRDAPRHVEALYQLGNVLAYQNRFGEAADCYRQLIELQPAHAEARNNLGVMLAEQRQFAAAISCYEQAIAIKPQYADAHYNLGNALKNLLRLEEAVASYRQALRLKAGFAGAHLNLGIALAYQGYPEAALAEYHEALQLSPDWAEAHNNLGLALSHLGRHVEALLKYDRALQLRPDFADAHYNRSLSWLALSNFKQGWDEYEWRWRLADVVPRRFAAPLWDGSELAGRTILLHCEQGLGDSIQFIRYAQRVKERGGTVLVEAPGTLLPLLARCRGIDRLVTRGEPLPHFDTHCPLMSLGRVFAAGILPIPVDIPYIFPDLVRVERWRQELSGLAAFKIGIAWQGSPGYRWDRLRSIPLTCFAPLGAVPGVRLISLQKGPGVDQLTAPRGFDVIDLSASLDEASGAFEDTAAVMCSLDLVIAADTAAAHLAGALGRPAWLALALAPEWRWQLGRADTPWYPTMRLFRQTRLGDWDELFGRMAAELRLRVASE
jgi:Flp pilus assembly protein TadD